MPKIVPEGSPKKWHLRRRANRHILKTIRMSKFSKIIGCATTQHPTTNFDDKPQNVALAPPRKPPHFEADLEGQFSTVIGCATTQTPDKKIDDN